MSREEAVALAQEIAGDRSRQWQAWHLWQATGCYVVDARHRPSQQRHFFANRDEWLAVKNHQPARRGGVRRSA